MSAHVPDPDRPLAVAPPAWLRWVVALSLGLCVLPAAFGLHYSMGWARVRAGKDVQQQRATLLGVTWFKPAFVSFLDRLERTVPPESRILIEPSRVLTYSGQARWQLYLNHYGYPLRFYTRKPAWASGTLVDYPRWLDHHTSPADLNRRLAEEAAIAERGIDWILRLPIAHRFRSDDVELLRRGPLGFEPVPLAGPRAGAERVDEQPDPVGGLEFDSGQGDGPTGP